MPPPQERKENIDAQSEALSAQFPGPLSFAGLKTFLAASPDNAFSDYIYNYLKDITGREVGTGPIGNSTAWTGLFDNYDVPDSGPMVFQLNTLDWDNVIDYTRQFTVTLN